MYIIKKNWPSKDAEFSIMSESHSKNHDYHLVDPSPSPAIRAIAAFVTAIAANI